MLYFENIGIAVDRSKNKIKLFIINNKMIVFKNILNSYLIHINFKYILPFI